MKVNRNSTHDIRATFDRSLVNHWLRDEREVIESAFERHIPDNHTSSKATYQTYNYAWKLYKEDLAES